uniref:Uncharacterized protein n=1 Tax=Chlamydomonas leiostraca TaxID=1034604 RepID=A0A7S0RVH0_9CHLO
MYTGEERELWEPLSPWCMFRAKVRSFARRIHPEALTSLAELFLVNGDMSAWLYTGSQAMHSERILIFEPENSKLRKAGVGAYGNIMVGIKRRYNNVLVDTDKQQQIEMFLGMKHSVYFPQVKLYYKEEGPVPLDYPESDDEDDPLARIDWAPAPDKSVHGGNAAGGSEGQPVVSHSRMRGKSFTTQELLAEFQRNQAALNKANATRAGSGGLLSSLAGPSATILEGPEGLAGGTSMHKVVSDSGMLAYLAPDNDKDSDTSSQASVTLTNQATGQSSLGRSASEDNLGGVPGSGGYTMVHGPSSGNMAAGQAGYHHSRHASGASTTSGSGSTTPERAIGGAGGSQRGGGNNVASALKTGLRKLTEPLGGLGIS